jgi:hypothetical protein
METKAEIESSEWTKKIVRVREYVAEKVLAILAPMEYEYSWMDSLIDAEDSNLIRELDRCYYLLQESWRTAQRLRRHILDAPLRKVAKETKGVIRDLPTLPEAKIKFCQAGDGESVIVGINHVADIICRYPSSEQSRSRWHVEWMIDAGLADGDGLLGFESLRLAEDYVRETVPKILLKFYDEN